MRAVGRLSREIACLDLHSRRGKGSLLQEENRHIRIVAGDHSIGRECHHRSSTKSVIHAPAIDCTDALTLMGASSSSNIGWEMKISRAFVHKYRISASNSCTCFPGLLPRTSRRRSMTESKSTSFWSAMICANCCETSRRSLSIDGRGGYSV